MSHSFFLQDSNKIFRQAIDSGFSPLSAYRDMLSIRVFEEISARSYKEGKINGFCHLYIGQESIAVGFNSALSKEDSIVTSYRCHGFGLLRGIPKVNLFAELFGRRDGSSAGKGGSMHIFCKKGRFFGGYGIVGAQVPIGTGIAMSEKYREKNAVCVVFMGEGALNQGQVYESFNMAKLLKLPVIYVIENNTYAMGTKVERGSANPNNLHQRGLGFGIPGIKVNGLDVSAVYNAARNARAKALEEGPILIEAMSYRYTGHSMSDPAKYRTKEEVENIKRERDSIAQIENLIIHNKISEASHLQQIKDEIYNLTHMAKDKALESLEPDLATLYDDVY